MSLFQVERLWRAPRHGSAFRYTKCGSNGHWRENDMGSGALPRNTRKGEASNQRLFRVFRVFRGDLAAFGLCWII